ncbi:MAG TPA: lectin-like protein, partial [Vicinamibacterales bacterium]|nr:lectin-like protein [Vicinamibacterales bacterium]
PLTWDDADAAATTRHGLVQDPSLNGQNGPDEPFALSHLATITSQAENDFVDGLKGPGDMRGWIGLYDATGTFDWQWVTGEPVGYVNWNPGEPNNYGIARWVEFSASGFWNNNVDDAHGLNQGYVVEYEPLWSFGPVQYTAYAGGTGGSPFGQITCPPGQLAVGGNDRAGNDNDAFGLQCASITGYSVGSGGLQVTTGSVTSTAYAGNGSGGAYASEACPAGYAMVGIFGTYTGSINAIATHCQKINGTDTADTGFGNGTPRYNSGGTSFDVRCPTGSYVVGIEGNSGALVDKLRMICQ